MSARRLTLQTIADQLGISRTTVSNAYNRPDQLGEELRAQILAMATELGYSGPSAAARSLRTGHRNAIGIVYGARLGHGFADPTIQALLQGVAEVSEAAGVAMMLVPTPEALAIEQTALQRVAVDGCIVYGVSDAHPVRPVFAAMGLPYVVVDQPRPEPWVSYVGVDDRLGARRAMEHVIGLGHRCIGILAFGERTEWWPDAFDDVDSSTAHVVRERMQGYRDALQDAGHRPADAVVWTLAANTIETAHGAAIEMLERHPNLTCIVAMSDQVAIGVMAAGRRVPEELSVVGFDDIPAAATTGPGITTIRQPVEEKGRQATWLLLNMLQGASPAHLLLDTELIIRGSTGPPAS